MYTLRQNALFTDEIELQKNDGTSEILKIKIDIRPELVKKYRELQVRFVDLYTLSVHLSCKSVPTVTPET